METVSAVPILVPFPPAIPVWVDDRKIVGKTQMGQGHETWMALHSEPSGESLVLPQMTIEVRFALPHALNQTVSAEHCPLFLLALKVSPWLLFPGIRTSVELSFLHVPAHCNKRLFRRSLVIILVDND